MFKRVVEGADPYKAFFERLHRPELFLWTQSEMLFWIVPQNRGTIGSKGGMYMMIGTVIGQVVLSRGVPGAGESRFVQVRCGCALVTALDPLGVQTGERVLVTAGDGNLRMCPEFPVDTVILGVAGNNG